MAKKRSTRASSWAIYGLLGFTAASVGAASCGGSKNAGPFQGGSSSGTSSTSSGGSGDDVISFSSGGLSSGGLSSGLGGSNGASSSGILPKNDAGVSIDDCTGSTTVSAATVKSLMGTATPDSAMKWLYPYDQTVFPGGILAPVLQWAPQAGGAPDAVYLHMYSQQFSYKGCFAKSYTDGAYKVSLEQLPIPAMRWSQALAQSNGGTDYLNVQITTITGGKVSALSAERWIIALGSLKGVIYYNTYNSTIAQMSAGTANGAVMQLKPGNATPTALLALAGTVPVGPCISCHSVSANGSMLAAQRHFYPGGLQMPGSMSFDLTTGLPNATMPTPLASTMNDDWGFSAVYPDGSLLLTAGEPQDSTAITGLFPVNNNNNPGMIGPKSPVMYDTKTGSTITYTGLMDTSAMMPMFSPDGKHIVYNDSKAHGGHGLVVQDFDVSTHAFSNPVQVLNDTSLYPGWPFFTPDNRYIIFASGGSNFASIPPGSFSSIGPVQAMDSDVAQSDLYVVCLKSPGTAHKLDIAGGIRAGTSYLPFSGTATTGGGDRDDHRSFYPTGSPVSAGGFFWIFFTSRRQYGNVMVDSMGKFPDPIFNPESKKIWAAAITEDGMETACNSGDPSHPAFLLPGQELTSGNIRAFAALAPCSKDGTTCTAGLDCCGGYCTNGKCGPPPTCSAINDKCSSTQPCCAGTPGVICLGGYCAVPPPPM